MPSVVLGVRRDLRFCVLRKPLSMTAGTARLAEARLIPETSQAAGLAGGARLAKLLHAVLMLRCCMLLPLLVQLSARPRLERSTRS